MGWEGSYTGVSGTLVVDANRLDEAISRYRQTPSPLRARAVVGSLGAPMPGSSEGGGVCGGRPCRRARSLGVKMTTKIRREAGLARGDRFLSCADGGKMPGVVCMRD